MRIKSILKKYTAKNSLPDAPILGAHSASEKNLMLVLSRFNAMMENAYEEKAPHKICAYIYELANAFNGFYHETKILSEEDLKVQAVSYTHLIRVEFAREYKGKGPVLYPISIEKAQKPEDELVYFS